MLQTLLVVPAFALAYLVAAPGWWVAIDALVPVSDGPYIGGSQNNGILDPIFGYNGFGRLTGNETGSVGGGRGWGATGWGRMSNASIGGQGAWLIPAALVLLVAALVAVGRAPRLDRPRASFVL